VIKMISTKITDHENWKLLYTYWNDLKFLKNIDSSNYNKIVQSNVKDFIIKYVRDGIEDDYSKKNNLHRRHAFTARELHEAYKKHSKKQKYSISNFHFHVKGLVKDGYLKKIAEIPDGRQKHTFYGRTAITYVPHYEEQITDQMNQNLYDPLKKLLKEMNQDLDQKYIDELLDKSVVMTKDYYNRAFSWFKANYPDLYTSRIDLREFLSYLTNFVFFHKEFYSNLVEIGSLLGLDKIESYPIYNSESEVKL